MIKIKTKSWINFLSALILIFGLLFLGAQRTLALNDSQNNFVNSVQLNVVMSNQDFIDTGSMTAQQIQDFLTTHGSYLQSYIDTSATGANRSAAQIIYDAAHGLYDAAVGTAHGVTISSSTGTINPKVIIVFLQKEEGLVDGVPPNPDLRVNIAMGYNCYTGVTGDNNGNNCRDSTEGFAMQVGWGAWQLRYNYEIAAKDSNWWGTYYSQPYYQVNASYTSGDGYSIVLTNQATASIYRYTPYVFYSAYNVWNIFYNSYSFGTSPGPYLPSSPPAQPPPPKKAGDINGDNNIDLLDLSILAAWWGTANVDVDFNHDGVVDLLDLSTLASAWGT